MIPARCVFVPRSIITLFYHLDTSAKIRRSMSHISSTIIDDIVAAVSYASSSSAIDITMVCGTVERTIIAGLSGKS